MKRWVLWLLVAWGALGPIVAFAIGLLDARYRLAEVERRVDVVDARTRAGEEFTTNIARRCCTP